MPRPKTNLRHAFLIAAALLAPAAARAGAAEPYPPKAPAAASLKEAFKGKFLVGVALNERQFSGVDAQATALITREFNCATPENHMKWEAIEPRPGGFAFEQADKFVAFCRQHDLVVIGHNLCWHAQLPSWVSRPDPGQQTLTREVLLARLKNHVQTVVSHFKGQVHGWDVVNEAIQDGSGEYRKSIFFRLIGPEYIALAFKWAHEADPGAELYYNDYNLDADDAKRAGAIRLVKYLREQHARIDGIGLQGHYNLSTPTAAKIDETIQMFSDLGLKVMISELDVEAIRDSRVTGAVGANTGGGQPRRRFFPPMETLKPKLGLTEAQVAGIEPLFDKATKDIGAAVASGDYYRIGEIREAAGDAAAKLLTASQRPPFAELMTEPLRRPVGPPPAPLTPEQQLDLARRYGELFSVFLKHSPSITRVTFWGLRDADSWRRRSSPLLFDDNYQRKPAYDAVIAAARQAAP